jgi:hypothetical protein
VGSLATPPTTALHNGAHDLGVPAQFVVPAASNAEADHRPFVARRADQGDCRGCEEAPRQLPACVDSARHNIPWGHDHLWPATRPYGMARHAAMECDSVLVRFALGCVGDASGKLAAHRRSRSGAAASTRGASVMVVATVLVHTRRDAVVISLRAGGSPVTATSGHGHHGPVVVLYVAIRQRIAASRGLLTVAFG